MKKIFFYSVFFLGISFFTSCKKDKCDTSTINLKNEVDSLSYSFGSDFANRFKKRKIEKSQINEKALMKGFMDAFNDKKEVIETKDARKLIQAFYRDMRKKKNKIKSDKYKNHRKENVAFLEKNRKIKGVEVLKSGLQYQILKKGKGETPSIKDKVKVHYHGTLIDGKIFDSSVKRGKPSSFKITGVIKGWTEALQLMHVGSKWRLFIPQELAYKDREAGKIPPYSTLIFEVELLEIEKQK